VAVATVAALQLVMQLLLLLRAVCKSPTMPALLLLLLLLACSSPAVGADRG
jgi:hypothetical protein